VSHDNREGKADTVLCKDGQTAVVGKTNEATWIVAMRLHLRDKAADSLGVHTVENIDDARSRRCVLCSALRSKKQHHCPTCDRVVPSASGRRQ
jgi:hypothetical protein